MPPWCFVWVRLVKFRKKKCDLLLKYCRPSVPNCFQSQPMKFCICHWSLYLVISPMIVVLIYVKSWLSTVFMLYDNPDYYAPSKLYEMSLWDVHMSSLSSVVGDKVKWKTALNTYIKTLFLIILYVWQVSNLHVFWENADLKLPKKYQKWQLPLSYYFG